MSLANGTILAGIKMSNLFPNISEGRSISTFMNLIHQQSKRPYVLCLAGLAAAADLGMGSHATERLSGKGGNGDSVMIRARRDEIRSSDMRLGEKEEGKEGMVHPAPLPPFILPLYWVLSALCYACNSCNE